MSETATCQIELDVLPALKRGCNFEHTKDGYPSNSSALNTTERYLLDASQATRNVSSPEESSTTIARNSGLRIGNVFIEDKVLHLLGSCVGVFVVGVNDTAIGANIPSIQMRYGLSYEVVSLVFLGGFGGYLVSCMLNSVLQSAIGARRVLMLAGVLSASGSLLIAFGPPFPAVVGGVVLLGFGGGFYEASLTSVVSQFEDSRLMNILYAAFGLGSLASPFIIGGFAKAGIAWNLYYWFQVSLALLVMACHFIVFKRYVTPSEEITTERQSVRARFTQTLRMKITWVGVVLIVLSFAIANTLSNWLTTYMIDVKGSGPDISRYQLSMFWAGLTLGRIFFSLPFIHIRERVGNSLLLALLCGAIAALWTVNSSVSNWLMIGVAGFFLGPNTPGILSIVSARVPPSLKGTVVSFTIGLGLVGATIVPLLFGIVAGKIGPGLGILPPVVIGFACMSALTFWAIPPREKRD